MFLATFPLKHEGVHLFRIGGLRSPHSVFVFMALLRYHRICVRARILETIRLWAIWLLLFR